MLLLRTSSPTNSSDGGCGEAAWRASTVAGTHKVLQQLCRWPLDAGEATTSRQPDEAFARPGPAVLVPDRRAAARAVGYMQGRRVIERRGTALIRLLVDTGIGTTELLGLAMTDLDSTRPRCPGQGPP